MIDRREDFINKAKIVHKGENLDYSKVVYKNNRTPVEIIDHDIKPDGTEYGPFWQTPSNHLKGQKHPEKRSINISKSKRSKQEDIIERFKRVHIGENLDYSKVKYVNMHTKVTIIDHDLDENGNEYGEYEQEPVVHLKGCGHPRKGRNKQADSQKYTTDTFIMKAKLLYDDGRFNYDEVNYINSKTKVKIFCNKLHSNGKPHGYFMAYPDLFLQGKSCPICGNHKSVAEDELYDLLVSIVGEKNVIKNDKKVLNGLELDLFVPSLNFAIEYNGLRWHSEEFKSDKYYHLNKTLECSKKGITLIQIFEDEYQQKKELIFDKIKNFLHVYNNLPSIFARKTIVEEININEAKDFLEKYHIQGFVSSSVYIGCKYCDELCGVMLFKKENSIDKRWELTRFATNINYKCPGVASKLLSYFIKKYNPTYIKSFLDYRWCNNINDNVYTKLNFKQDCILKPDYKYTNGHGKRKHKFGFRKQILNKKYGFDLKTTESQMVKELGYYKIWDCGLIKYVWENKKAQEQS